MTGVPKESCLHCEVNEVVQRHVRGKDVVDLPDLVGRMAESLANLILLGPENEWSNLLAAAISDLGHAFLEKSGAVESETTH